MDTPPARVVDPSPVAVRNCLTEHISSVCPQSYNVLYIRFSLFFPHPFIFRFSSIISSGFLLPFCSSPILSVLPSSSLFFPHPLCSSLILSVLPSSSLFFPHPLCSSVILSVLPSSSLFFPHPLCSSLILSVLPSSSLFFPHPLCSSLILSVLPSSSLFFPHPLCSSLILSVLPSSSLFFPHPICSSLLSFLPSFSVRHSHLLLTYADLVAWDVALSTRACCGEGEGGRQ